MGREVTVWVIGFAWLSAVVCGFWVWERYDTTAGTARAPVVATNENGGGRWQLTVFVHPRCPCSTATLRELTEIAGTAPSLSTRVRFVHPNGAPAGWERGESWDAATRVPGAEVACDEDGIEARRFGAETSGHAILTDPAGRVVFRGGLTVARGRTGESSGRRAVLAWVDGRAAAAEAPVFGCPLFTPDD